MATDGISPALALRSSVGVEVWSTTNANKTYAPAEQFSRDESKFCRAIEFSPDGRYLAWANGTKVQIACVDNWNVICSLPRPKAVSIKFSPKGTYLATLEHYSTPKDGSEPQPNFNVYRTSTGESVYAIINKNFGDDWTPGWTDDESLFALMIGGEALFFETNGVNGFQKSAKKIGSCRGGELSIAGYGNNPHVSLYVPGAKGQPSVCKIFRYPALDAAQVVSSKSFFQADRVEMMWNKRASGLILMTSTDVDSTGASYYGKQTLHYLNIKGDSCSVALSKEGPIHAVEWNPKGNEFCVVYGYMPAKATFFNLKCDPIFEVKEAPRNSIYFNSFGNIVLLAGFGNLRGNVEVWNANEKKLITTFQAPDSTLLEWAPDGETILTATTAPRLRIGNGFKVWHYSGALLHETTWPSGQELLEVVWQRYENGVFTEKPISNVKVQGIQPSQPQSSKAVYVPPNIRSGGLSASPRNPSEYQAAEKPPIPGLPIGYKVSQSQLKKNRNAKRKNNTENANENSNITVNATQSETTTTQSSSSPNARFDQLNNKRNNQRRPSTKSMNSNQNGQNNINNIAANGENISPANGEQHQSDANDSTAQQDKPKRDRRRNNNRNRDAPASTGDPEKDKRIRVVQQKLRDISKLKARRDNGEQLEANQVSKINSESELIKELNTLKIFA